MAKCSSCGGTGYVVKGGIGPNGPAMGRQPCPICSPGRAVSLGDVVNDTGSAVMRIIGVIGVIALGIAVIAQIGSWIARSSDRSTTADSAGSFIGFKDGSFESATTGAASGFQDSVQSDETNGVGLSQDARYEEYSSGGSKNEYGATGAAVDSDSVPESESQASGTSTASAQRPNVSDAVRRHVEIDRIDMQSFEYCEDWVFVEARGRVFDPDGTTREVTEYLALVLRDGEWQREAASTTLEYLKEQMLDRLPPEPRQALAEWQPW